MVSRRVSRGAADKAAGSRRRRKGVPRGAAAKAAASRRWRKVVPEGAATKAAASRRWRKGACRGAASKAAASKRKKVHHSSRPAPPPGRTQSANWIAWNSERKLFYVPPRSGHPKCSGTFKLESDVVHAAALAWRCKKASEDSFWQPKWKYSEYIPVETKRLLAENLRTNLVDPAVTPETSAKQPSNCWKTVRLACCARGAA